MFEKEIKEDQPDLLKTICDIALYGSTTYKKKKKRCFLMMQFHQFYRGDCYECQKLFKICDCYPYKVQVKGAFF